MTSRSRVSRRPGLNIMSPKTNVPPRPEHSLRLLERPHLVGVSEVVKAVVGHHEIGGAVDKREADRGRDDGLHVLQAGAGGLGPQVAAHAGGDVDRPDAITALGEGKREQAGTRPDVDDRAATGRLSEVEDLVSQGAKASAAGNLFCVGDVPVPVLVRE